MKSRALTSAPRSSSSWITSSLPLPQAIQSAVMPISFLALTSAPPSSAAFRAAASLLRTAAQRAERESAAERVAVNRRAKQQRAEIVRFMVDAPVGPLPFECTPPTPIWLHTDAISERIALLHHLIHRIRPHRVHERLARR